MQHPVIPLTLPQYLRDFVGQNECRVQEDTTLCRLLQTLDPEEQYCHIEWPCKQNKLSYPVIWHRKTWIVDVDRQMRLKAKSAADSKAYEERKKALRLLVSSISQKTGLDEEASLGIARDIIQKKDSNRAMFFAGLSLAQLPDEPKWRPV